MSEIVNDHQFYDGAKDVYAWAEQCLGLPHEFFLQLSANDDWTFLIKWHAVLEAAVNHLLAIHFAKPELVEVFAHLEMSNFRSGKMGFVSKCGLLPKDCSTFIQKLSEMRNFVVHDIKNFRFSFNDYSKTRGVDWIGKISFAFPEQIIVNGHLYSKKDVAQADPRWVVEVGCFKVILCIFSRQKGESDDLEAIHHMYLNSLWAFQELHRQKNRTPRV